MRLLQRSLLLLAVLSLAACANFPQENPQPAPQRRVKTIQPTMPQVYSPARSTPSTSTNPTPTELEGPAPSWEKDFAPQDIEIPEDIEQIPDAVPVDEPRSRGGNSKSYEVLGKTYKVMNNAKGFTQRGHASWYGKKFHGRKTANGERYDMFKMTAAHKSLPIPSYVRVTDLDNGKSVIVRINDRGPFHGGRIIDLSYAAAAKIGLIGHGTSEVEITAIDPDEYSPAEAPAEPIAVASVAVAPAPAIGPAAGYLQIGAYINPVNANNLQDSLQGQGFESVQIRISYKADAPIHRVLLGPFRNELEARDTRARLDARNLIPQWVKE